MAKRIIGAKGSKMKDIVRKSGDVAKLRLRGKGSGFAERDTGEESPEPLQLCISSPSYDGYEVARRCAEELLLQVYDEYEEFYAEKGIDVTMPTIRMTEKHMDGAAGGRGRIAPGPAPDTSARRRGRGKKGKAAQTREASEDRGEPPDGAPSVDEIEQMIADRNACRKRGEYSKADRIRDDLKARGVVLSDEKGAHGDGLTVTSWRYWRE